MELTKDQTLQIIAHNIAQAEEIVRRISGANKGQYCHDLNAGEHNLMELIRKTKSKKVKALDDPTFKAMCMAKQNMAATLYMAANGI